MREPSTRDRQHATRVRTSSADKVFVMTLIIGILMGMVITCLFAYSLYFFGYIAFPGEDLSPSGQVTELRIPVCPTCEGDLGETDIIIVTPTSSPTPDTGATATAACDSFNEQFPGTPCPTVSNP